MKKAKIVAFRDAVEMHHKHPKTFEIPTKKEIKSIEVGTNVKVCYDNERFWVRVTKIRRIKFEGTVNNILGTPKLKFNDLVIVSPQHIYAVE